MRRRVYYTIDVVGQNGSTRYRVCRRRASDPLATTVGEYDSLAAAMASVDAEWRSAASRSLEAWALASEAS